MASPAMERPQGLRVTLILIGAIVAPSILLSLLALRAIEAERVNIIRQVEQGTKAEADVLVVAAGGALTEAAEELARVIAGVAGSTNDPRDVVPVLRALLEGGDPARLPFDSLLVLDAQGRRVHPPSLELLLRGQEAGRELPPLEAVQAALADAQRAEFVARDMDAAIEAYERLEAMLNRMSGAYPRLRAEVNLALARVQAARWAGSGELIDLYNARLNLSEVVNEATGIRDRHGTPVDLGARVELAEVTRKLASETMAQVHDPLGAHEGLLGRAHETLFELLDQLVERRDELAAEEISVYLAEAVERLPTDDPRVAARLEPYRALAALREREDAWAERMEAAFRPALVKRIERGDLLTRPVFLKQSRGQERPLVALSLPLPPRVAREGQVAMGVVALRLDVDRFLGGPIRGLVDRQNEGSDRQRAFAIVERTADDPLVGADAWNGAAEPVAESEEGARWDPIAALTGEGVPEKPDRTVVRAPLGFPLEHLEVRGRSDVGVAVQRLRSSGRRMLHWTIILSVSAMALGALGTVRTLVRESRIAQQKTDFVSNVTHELKTPLTSIGMFIETLEMDRIDSDDERREILSMMARERDRLGSMIERLLSFSRIEAGRYRYDFSFEDPVKLVEKALARFHLEQEMARRKPVDIEITCLQSVSEVLVDPDAIEEVLLNLLHNAQKYTPAIAGRKRFIGVTVSERRRAVWIDVDDNGIGVARRDRRRIFKKFERGTDPQAKQIAGSGIGLTLSLSIARAHGGDIRYSPRRPRGSRFSLVLPRQRRRAGARPPEDRAAPPGASADGEGSVA